MEACLCNRIRFCIWHDRKKPDRKRKNLIRLGVENGDTNHAQTVIIKFHPSNLRFTSLDLENRRIRDPYHDGYRGWCERRTPSVNSGGAVDSIGRSILSTIISAAFPLPYKYLLQSSIIKSFIFKNGFSKEYSPE